ncbi:MAG: hypothetical protein LBL94_05895 [Prevotellaceae bacterium]|jgi:hypothetical protein|nr:hypothetical protein [Prevotellaceae bacterium]
MKILKKILILLLAVASAGAAVGQVKKVAILNPVARGGVLPMHRAIVLGNLKSTITGIAGYEAFTRTDIDAIIFEQNFQRSGMVNEAERRRLGIMSGVDYICTSVLTADKASGELYVEASLIRVESGLLERSDNELMKMSPNSAIRDGCKRLAARLLGEQEYAATGRFTINSVEFANTDKTGEILCNYLLLRLFL